MKLYIFRNSNMLISNVKIVFFFFFQILLNLPTKTFLVPSLKIFLLWMKLWNFTFQSDDFQYDNSFLKLPPKTIQIRHFSPKYEEFLFLLENLRFEKFEGVHSKYDHRFFKFLPNKWQVRHFPSQRTLGYFATKLVD